MRHRRQTHRLGRNFSKRRAMLENMVSSLLSHQEITTTLEKAKAAKRLADRVISLGKTDSLASRRKVFSYLQDHDLTSRLFKEVAPRFKERKGGYTRILQLHRRKGDGATLALLQLTEREVKAKPEKKPKKGELKAEKIEALSQPKSEAQKTDLTTPEKETFYSKKSVEPKKEKPKTGFFKNLGKFFRNKGGG